MMDTLASCTLSTLSLATVLVVKFSAVHARWEEASLEAQWKLLHPKPRHCPNHWHEVDTLTHEQHRRICDDVVYQTMDFNSETIDNYTYINASDIRKERVTIIPVEFLHGIGDTLMMQLVICRYKEKEFYLAHGGEDTVFRLVEEPDRGVIFKSGLHRVLYDPYKWGEGLNPKEKKVDLPSALKSAKSRR